MAWPPKTAAATRDSEVHEVHRKVIWQAARYTDTVPGMGRRVRSLRPSAKGRRGKRSRGSARKSPALAWSSETAAAIRLRSKSTTEASGRQLFSHIVADFEILAAYILDFSVLAARI
jgi:hypothetical protein